MKLTIITFLCLFSLSFLYAQNKTVKGILISKNGIPLSGYTIVLDGTTIGTQSGNCGEFELNIPENFDGAIVISAITPRSWKMKSQKLKRKSFYTIILKSQKEHANRNCDLKIEKKNVIKIK